MCCVFFFFKDQDAEQVIVRALGLENGNISQMCVCVGGGGGPPPCVCAVSYTNQTLAANSPVEIRVVGGAIKKQTLEGTRTGRHTLR